MTGDSRLEATGAAALREGHAGAQTRSEPAGLPETLGALCLVGVMAAHLLDLSRKVEEAPYIASLFMALMGASVTLALLLVFGRHLLHAWYAAIGLSSAAIAGYVLSRSVELPQIEDHVGHWLDPVGATALAFEAAVVVLGVQSLRLRPLQRALVPAMSVLVFGLVAAAGAAASGGEQGHGDAHDPTFHLGNTSEYPSASEASSSVVATKARSLLIGARRSAWQFDTVSEAASRGYYFSARGNRVIGRPAIRHMRKNGGRYWGRLLDPRAPQSLVFWCPSRGPCVLAAYMFRAPSDSSPPTYGDTLSWHRHSPRDSWMTHVWFTERMREAFANCVPFNALRTRGIEHVPYKVDIVEDQACSDTVSTFSEIKRSDFF